MRLRNGVVTVFAVLLVGFTSRVSAVNLSRYRLTVTSTLFSTSEELDLSKVRGFCRDEDGCLVTMRFELHPNSDPAVLLVKTARLFLAPDTLTWSTEEAGGKDADDSRDVVLSLGSASTLCELSDGQIGGLDAETGFSLYAIYTSGTAECVVTLVD